MRGVTEANVTSTVWPTVWPSLSKKIVSNDGGSGTWRRVPADEVEAPTFILNDYLGSEKMTEKMRKKMRKAHTREAHTLGTHTSTYTWSQLRMRQLHL